MRSLVLRKSDLDRLYIKDKKTPQFTHLADCYIEEGDLERAIELCENGLKHYPDNATAHYILGKCYYLQKRYKDAKSELERAIKYYPAYISSYKLLIEINKLDGLNQVVQNLEQEMYLYSPFARELSNTELIKPENLEEAESHFEVVKDDEVILNEPDETDFANFITEETFNNDEEQEDINLDDFDLGDLTESIDEEAESLGLVSDFDLEEESKIEVDDTIDAIEEDSLDADFDIEESNSRIIDNIQEPGTDEKKTELIDAVDEKPEEETNESVDETFDIVDSEKIAVEENEDSQDKKTEEKVADLESKNFFELTEEELFHDDPEHLKTLSAENTPESKEDVFHFDDLSDADENVEIFEDKSSEDTEITDTELTDKQPDIENSEVQVNIPSEAEGTVKENTPVEEKATEPSQMSDEPSFLKATIHHEGELDNVQKAEDVLEHVDKEGNPLRNKLNDDELLDDELSFLRDEKSLADEQNNQGIVSSTLGEIYLAQGQFKEAYDVFKQLIEKDPDNEKLKRKLKDIEALLNDEG